MYKGIYLALSGAVLKERQLEVISQNLSNANTNGYKKDKIAFRDYLIQQHNGLNEDQEGKTMADMSEVVTDYSPGAFRKTGNNLDIAIDGSGFISLEHDQFSRRGDLKLDNEGYLTSNTGARVQGENGDIKLSGSNVQILGNGEVFVDGVVADKIKIVDFDNPKTIRKVGEGVFVSDVPGKPSKSVVQQGFLETSNVSAIKEMVTMISSMREFESFQKTIQAFDEAASHGITEMGRL
ncbi:MAG: flagellar hook-basal body protein [Nitrospirae bacterium]|nr:flagellar hook-basal body protein [Nitrospirota bacterium]